MVRFRASVDCEQVFSTVVYIAVHTNVARNAFRDASSLPQHMAIVEPNSLWSISFVSKSWNRETKIKRPLLLLRSTACRGFEFLPSLPCIKASRCPRRKLSSNCDRPGARAARRPATLLVRGACRAQGLSTMLPSSKQHSRIETKGKG